MTYCECPFPIPYHGTTEKCGRCFRRCEPEPNYCPKCEGDGSYSDLADCTTFDKDCRCNFERVTVDPCGVCSGSGMAPLPSRETGDTK